MFTCTVCVTDRSLTQFLLQVKAEGLEVLAVEERVLSKEEAAEFYKQHEESVSFLLHCN